MKTDVSDIENNLKKIRASIKNATLKAGRKGELITLLAVCKHQKKEKILDAYRLGIRDFGENTVQNMFKTIKDMPHTFNPKWHFIGSLQANKVNKLITLLPTIHSIDKFSIAKAISKRTLKPISIFIQVNIGTEPQKQGVYPDDLFDFAKEIKMLPNLSIEGLMAIPPKDKNAKEYFKNMQNLSKKLSSIDNQYGKKLSMGMSDDFETAITYGATTIRLGKALFGARDILF